jgi:hypothetical protein
MIWRLLIAFVAGLVLGLVVSFLASAFGWSLPVVLLVPLLTLLGVLGRLAAARTNPPFQSGWGLGGWALFGIWLAAELWTVLTPYTVQDCFVNCYPDPPTTESFWAYSLWPLVLAISVFLLAAGQLVVLAGVAVTHLVLKLIANTPASSR